jgi:hypothetical protein
MLSALARQLTPKEMHVLAEFCGKQNAKLAAAD